MRPSSLSLRLFIVTAVALVPALGIALSSVLTLQQDSETALHAEAYRTAELASLELEQTISGAESVLRTMAAAPVVKRGVDADCSAMLTEAAGALPFLTSLVIVNEDGSVRCASDASAAGQTLSARNYFIEALRTGVRVTGTATDGITIDQRRLPIALRIGGLDGAPTGVAIAYLKLGWLEERLLDRKLVPGSSLTIADRNGTIIARVPEPEKFVGTVIPDAYRYLVDEPKPGTLEVVSQDGTRRMLGYFPPAANASGLYISAGMSTAQGYATLRSVTARAALIAVTGAAAASLLAYYTARVFIAKPVRKLIDTVAAWRNGETSARTGMKATEGEICGAGQSLDAFMDELLANREARQKSDEARALLSDELEHRVKNLLATVRSIAKQTFPREGNEAAMEAFSQRLQAIGEANKLLKQAQWQTTPLRALVQSSVAPFTGSDDSRVHMNGPDLVLRGNVALAVSMALHELCTNAIKYGALSTDEGKILIEWDVTKSAGGDRFKLLWREQGGPRVQSPAQTGFGSKVIKYALAAQVGGGVDLRYEPAGLVCEVVAPAQTVLVDPEAAAA